MIELLEDRRLLATLDIVSGALTYEGTASASALTVSTTGPAGNYTFADTAQPITLTASAMTAGWSNGDANTVTGPDNSVSSIAITTGAAPDTITIESVDADTTIDSGAGDDTLDFIANGIPAGATATVNNTANSGRDTFDIDTGGTPGTFATGQFGREKYQASGKGLIDITSDKPAFFDSLTGLASGALTLNLNTLYTTPTALTTTISVSSGQMVADVSEVFPRYFQIGSLASVSVGGTSAGEGLTVDFSNGDPLPSTGLTYSPSAAGQGASNALTLQGGSFTSEVYNATGPGAGSVTYNASKTINFSNLSPINDTVSSPTYIFNPPAGTQTINVTVGPIVGVQTDQINDGGTASFELVNFGNKTAVTVNAPASGTTTTLNFPTPAAGLSTLNVVSGGGNEVVNVQTTSAGVITNVDTGSAAGSTIHVGLNGNISPIFGPVFVKSTGGSTSLAIDDSGEDGPQTYNIVGSRVTATSFPSFIDFSGGGITTLDLTSGGLGDTFNFTGPVQSDIATYNFSADGGAGPNVLNVTSNVSTLNFATAGVLTFGTGRPILNYFNFQTINVTKPASRPVGTGTTITVNEGQALITVVVATFTENDLGNVASDFTASIDWGDTTAAAIGTIQPNGSNGYNILGSHTYDAAGTYPVTITLTDLGSQGTTTVAGTTIHVTSTGPITSTPNPIVSTAAVAAAPLSAQGATVSGREGIALNPAPGGDVLVATFMDTGTPGTPADYSASIDWGDGSAATAATQITAQGTPNGVVFSVFGNHTYAEEGTNPITVTITKTASGATAIASGQAVLADALLTAGATVALTPNTGVLLSNAVVGRFTDANSSAPAGDFTATIDWGDGMPTSLGTVVAGTTVGTFEVQGTHAYARPGTYTTRIVVADVGGSIITLPGTATVTDPALTGTANAVSAVEGITTGTIVLATITNPNTLATAANLTATVDWGDSTGTFTVPVTLIGATAAGTIFQVTGSHTYAIAGPHTVLTTVTTTGGATTTTSPLTAMATVADAPITAAGASITGIEGNSTGSVIIATFSDANPGATVADFTTGGGSVVVSWGDGSALETLPGSAVTSSGSPNGVLFTVTAAHTYAEEGHYQLTVTITDTDGSRAVASGSATIADAPLTGVTPLPVVTVAEGVLFQGVVVAFNDANPNATASEFRATIDWGDGSPQTAGVVQKSGISFTVSGSHTYADSLPIGAPGSGVPGPQNGTYLITISVTDVGGSQLNLTNTATVIDDALTVAGKLNPASDSGRSNSDNITNVVQPTFLGTTSEPAARVWLYAQPTSGGVRILIGQGTADATGGWSITANQALADGGYAISAIAVDSSGHTISNTTTIVPNLVIDTVGPKVTTASFNRFQGQIQVAFQDYGGPGGAGVGLILATVIDANNYAMTKVHHPRLGQFRVNAISVTPGTTTGAQVTTLSINGGHYIRGGFYFFTIRSARPGNTTGIQDLAGNALDGEFYGYFPSGNNRPGGDFVAQLTAIHHTIFAPSTVIGRATPVSPPGTRGQKVTVPTTFNQSHLARRAVATAQARRSVHAARTHASAGPKGRHSWTRDLFDEALDQLHDR